MRRVGCIGLLLGLAAIVALFGVVQMWGGRGPLGRPISVSALEIDLGAAADDHPRRVRVAAAAADETPWLVWEGATRGGAVLGLLDDRTRRALTLELPPSPPVRRLIVTITEEEPGSRWSIAELRVFGR